MKNCVSKNEDRVGNAKIKTHRHAWENGLSDRVLMPFSTVRSLKIVHFHYRTDCIVFCFPCTNAIVLSLSSMLFA